MRFTAHSKRERTIKRGNRREPTPCRRRACAINATANGQSQCRPINFLLIFPISDSLSIISRGLAICHAIKAETIKMTIQIVDACVCVCSRLCRWILFPFLDKSRLDDAKKRWGIWNKTCSHCATQTSGLNDFLWKRYVYTSYICLVYTPAYIQGEAFRNLWTN